MHRSENRMLNVTSEVIISSVSNEFGYNNVLDHEPNLTGQLPQQKGLQDSAIRIHLIAAEIFANLNFLELKCLRLVNHNWCIATSQFIQDKMVPLSFKSCSKKLENFYSTISNRTSLFLDPANQFPCKNFTFHLTQDIGSLNRFLLIQGSFIKSLKIFYDGDKNFESFLIPPLLLATPNLFKLYLRSCDIQCPDDLTLSFPSLQKFAVTFGLKSRSTSVDKLTSTLAYKILQGAPNLSIVKGFTVCNLNFFKSLNKIHLFKSIRIPSPIYLENLNNFVEIQQRISKLTICFDDTIFIKSEIVQLSLQVSKILEFSKNSLNKLSLQPLLIFNDIQYPQLSQVTNLEINVYTLFVYDRDQDTRRELVYGRIFKEGLNMEKIFPNLKNLSLNLGDFSEQSILKYFPSAQGDRGEGKFGFKFEKLTNLELTVSRGKQLSKFSLESLATICPKLRALKLNLSSHKLELVELTEVFRIWKGVQLKELRLMLSNYIHCDRDFILDSVLTGIPAEKCAIMRARGNGKDWGCLDILRIKPSICDLQGLKIFRIDHGEQKYCKQLVSRVSKLYAFDLMNDLQVTINY